MLHPFDFVPTCNNDIHCCYVAFQFESNNLKNDPNTPNIQPAASQQLTKSNQSK